MKYTRHKISDKEVTIYRLELTCESEMNRLIILYSIHALGFPHHFQRYYECAPPPPQLSLINLCVGMSLEKLMFC